MKIFINGFGRIGRTVLRQVLQQDANAIEIVGINDIADADTCAYLLRYDSVFGAYPHPVEATEHGLKIGNISIPLWRVQSICELDLSGVDVVLECTGKAKDRQVTEAGLKAGARSVLVSGPSDAVEKTIVLGANEAQLGDERIVSNASCTTNAIAPLLCALDQQLGVDRAHVTTVHCYTGSQPTVDMPGSTLERSRAAGVSMIPTSTSAAGQLGKVLPDLSARLTVAALRVPAISVSAIDLVLQLSDWPTDDVKDTIGTMVRTSGVMASVDDACVSSDLRGRPESLILATRETQVLEDKQIRLFGWYDNEWGFSARMLDLARLMADRKTAP